MTVTGTITPVPTVSAPAPVAPPVHRRRWVGGLLAVVGLAGVVIAHLAMSAPVRVPIIHPDELGYLLNARVLARGGLRSQVEYYPGFSVLLIPVWWATSSPLTVFRSTLFVQAGLSGVGALLSWRLSRVLAPGLGAWRRALVVAVVCAYPSFLLYSDLALSEVAFATIFVGIVVLAAAALPGRRVGWWAGLGVSSGLLVAVHPRGLAVVVATVALGALVLGWRRSSVAPFVALVAGTIGALAVTRGLVDAVRAPATVLGAYQPDSVLSKSLSAHGLSSLGVELAGQLFYLSVATFGLVPLGLLVGGRALVQVARGERRVPTLVSGYATLSFLGVWALSSLFMNLGNRADKLIYGRYNEGVIIPMMLIALADLMGASREGRGAAARRWLGAGLVAAIATGAVVDLGNSKAALFGAVNPVNVLGLAPVLARMAEHIHVLAIAGMGAGAVLALSLLSWRLPAVALLAVVALFAASAIDTETGYVVPGSQARAEQGVVASSIAAIRAAGLGPVPCVAYDLGPLRYGDYNYFEDQFLVPDQLFAPFDPSGSRPPCGTLVVSRQADFPARHPGARVVTAENYTAQTLWAVPGAPLFTQLAANGWLSPSGASSPLPASARSGGRLVPGAPIVLVSPGESATVEVTAVHGPGGAPWPAVNALHSGSGKYGVRLTVQSYGPTELRTGGAPTACVAVPGHTTPTHCDRVDLPTTLLPGQTEPIPIQIRVGYGTPPGSYQLELGMVQEGVGEFSARAQITVVVGSL
ncbi:MAG TPA: hypothetical protein VGI06_10370 [Acidimicrobiales bacterium]